MITEIYGFKDKNFRHTVHFEDGKSDYCTKQEFLDDIKKVGFHIFVHYKYETDRVTVSFDPNEYPNGLVIHPPKTVIL